MLSPRGCGRPSTWTEGFACVQQRIRSSFRCGRNHEALAPPAVECHNRTPAPQPISSLSAKVSQQGHEAARTPLVHKTERPRDDGLRLETIITRRATPGYVLVRSHQHQPASIDRDEIRLIDP